MLNIKRICRDACDEAPSDPSGFNDGWISAIEAICDHGLQELRVRSLKKQRG